MAEEYKVTEQVQAALADVTRLSPAKELASYEQVLHQLTELLNAPDEHGLGTN